MKNRRQSNRSVSSYSHSRRQSSNRSSSSRSQSSQESIGGGKIRPLLGREMRLPYSRSAICVALRLNGGDAATQRHQRSNFGSRSTDRLPSATTHARSFDLLQASSRNAEWNDIPIASPPLTCVIKDANAAKNNLFAELVGLKVTPEVFASKVPTKSVHFSTDKDDLIEYEISPQDLRNSWYTTDIPRTLENLDSISYHRGLKVSYPESVYQGKECMIRIEPPAVIDEIIKIKEKHREAVLKEQARQVSSGKTDADALGKAALAHSERGVEIASSSWWLERMNYRE